MNKVKRIFKRLIIILIILSAVIYLAFKVSPWPSVMLIRHAVNSGEDIKVNKSLEKYVPSSINSILNQQYDPSGKDVFLDVYFPNKDINNTNKFPVIMWIHGGGLISGSKDQIANYCKVLSSKGFTVIAIDYTVAPEGKYPTPLIQANTALKYIEANADRFKADTSFIVLAGDSGGAMIAAQVANTIYDQQYAQVTKVEPGLSKDQLKGLLLYCGIYDIGNLNMEGPFGSFLKTVIWSYFGKKDISNDRYANTASIYEYVTKQYPPCFISVGNGDPLLLHSLKLSKRLSDLGVEVDTLFFPDNTQPALPHEYQFLLDTDAGQKELARSLVFMENLKNKNKPKRLKSNNIKTIPL